MRGYREKMQLYRLPAPRIRELRVWCLLANGPDIDRIKAAATDACGDNLAPWIVRHVTQPRMKWDVLEAEGIPCSVDTFRVYRARFFSVLNRMLTAPTSENAPQGGDLAAKKDPPGGVYQASSSMLAG